jgi:hypothetical protein
MQGANIAVMNKCQNQISSIEAQEISNLTQELMLTKLNANYSTTGWVLMKIDDIYEEIIDGKYNNRQITVKLRSYRPGEFGDYFTISKSYKGECEYWALRADVVPIVEGDHLDMRGHLDGSLIGLNVVATIKQGSNGSEVVDLSRVIWPTSYRHDVDYANDFTRQEIHDLLNPKICPAKAA